MDFKEFSPPIKYGATIGQALYQTVAGDVTFDAKGTATFTQGLPFIATTTVGTISVGSGSGVIVVDPSNVTGGRKIYLTGFSLLNGANSWGSANLYLNDAVS